MANNNPSDTDSVSIIDFNETQLDAASSTKDIDENVSKHIVMQAIQKISGARDPNQTASAFFTLEDLFTVLNRFPDWKSKWKELGFRVYYGKYDINDPTIKTYMDTVVKEPKFEGKPTVLLQLMSKDNKTFHVDQANKLVTANLGQLCPPKCPDGHTRPDDKFWDPSIV